MLVPKYYLCWQLAIDKPSSFSPLRWRLITRRSSFSSWRSRGRSIGRRESTMWSVCNAYWKVLSIVRVVKNTCSDFSSEKMGWIIFKSNSASKSRLTSAYLSPLEQKSSYSTSRCSLVVALRSNVAWIRDTSLLKHVSSKQDNTSFYDSELKSEYSPRRHCPQKGRVSTVPKQAPPKMGSVASCHSPRIQSSPPVLHGRFLLQLLIVQARHAQVQLCMITGHQPHWSSHGRIVV